MRKKKICIILSMLCIASTLSISGCNKKASDNSATKETKSVSNEVVEEKGDKTYDFGLADTTKEGAILHAFSWSFATITESMADIAAAGYTSVQTSPINECYDGDSGGQLYGDGKWYYHYQPTDYKIGNYQLGTKDEFIAMCDEADKYGIKIIVDVATNHTTPHTECVSEDLLNAVGGADKLYHQNGMTGMTKYGDRLNCTAYSMGGLPDIDTENPDYQNYIIEYLNECIECGADGFRFDAAKHIALSDDPSEDEQECNFWDTIIGGLDNKDNLFNYGEVLQGDNERINAYIDTIGAATASAYGKRIRYYVTTGDIRSGDLTNFFCNDSTDIVLWVESHDNYINDKTSQVIDDEDIILSWAILASRSEGTPLFFPRPYGADKDNVWGTVNEIGVAGSPLYKSPTVSAVNRFKNAMIGEGENLVNPEDSTSVLLIERGTKGLVIVNVGDEYGINMQTALSDGTYINRVDGKTEYVVKDGMISGTIQQKSAIVLYNEGYKEPEVMPVVSADADEYYAISTDEVKVTLHVSGAEKGYYVLGDGEEVEFTDGTVISVGDSLKAGDSIKLTVKASNKSNFTSAMSYFFTKAAPKEEVTIADGMTIYFNKPSDWDDVVNAYVYDESSGSLKTIQDWPGKEMTDEGNGLYSYTFESEWGNGLIMFSDGTRQYPAQNQAGLPIEEGKTYSKE